MRSKIANGSATKKKREGELGIQTWSSGDQLCNEYKFKTTGEALQMLVAMLC